MKSADLDRDPVTEVLGVACAYPPYSLRSQCTRIGSVDWETVMFLFAGPLGLTQDPAFTDNVLYWLLEEPRQE